MASGRFLSKTIANDLSLSRLSLEAYALFISTIPHLDRDGLILGKPIYIAGTAAPLRDELTDKTAELIEEWVSAGLVTRYHSGSEPILFFHGFRKNQIGLRYDREYPSRFPAPPGMTRDESGLIPEGIRNQSGSSPAQDQDQEEDQDQDQDPDDDWRTPIFDLIEFVGWKDAKTAVSKLTHRQAIDFSTWVWAYQYLRKGQTNGYCVDYDAQYQDAYSKHPFRQARKPVGYALAAAVNGDAFPLDEDDQAALSDWMTKHAEREMQHGSD